MQFELTEALIDHILFSMEDQAGDFFVDAQEGIVVGGSDEFDETIKADGDRYLYLPGWESSDGFKLMERFAASLRNPLIREQLSAALNRGRGVFRAFKDILGQYPESEKLWFAYKERAMKREIFRWYNALREEWGLEKIGGEPEDTEDLVLEDFRIRDGVPEDTAAAKELHRLCAGTEDWTFPGDYTLAAETAGGEFAGYISARLQPSRSGAPDALHIYALEVKPEFRGLGIGEALINGLMNRIANQKIAHISIDLPAEMEAFSRVLLRNSFGPQMVRYRRAGGKA
ncbi:MAG: GNAT family N-acetyltransferase [Treponema sp.]|jgi:ribosomal protein S18 acetylase RimI-like enzyme|nr:GNAT family N-acetyltransferase [Treponema sp.]